MIVEKIYCDYCKRRIEDKKYREVSVGSVCAVGIEAARIGGYPTRELHIHNECINEFFNELDKITKNKNIKED